MSPSSRFETLQARVGMCLACCQHGGMCTLLPAHEGLHQARDESDVVVCQWPDAESISRQEADVILAAGGHEWAVAITAYLESEILEAADDVR